MLDDAAITAAKFTTAAWLAAGERMLAATLAEMCFLVAPNESSVSELAAFVVAWACASPDLVRPTAMAIAMVGQGAGSAEVNALETAGKQLISALKLALGSYGAEAAAAVGKRVAQLRGMGVLVQGSVIGTIAAEVMTARVAGAGIPNPRTAQPGSSSLELDGVESGGAGQVRGRAARGVRAHPWMRHLKGSLASC